MEKDFARGPIRFVCCDACHTWNQSPCLTKDSVTAWFDSDDYQQAGANKDGPYLDYASGEEARFLEARARYRRDLRRWLKPGSHVLEVGCATASQLAALKEDGHQVLGIDLSERFAEQARKLYGIEVKAGDFLEFDLPDGTLDAVLMLGTIGNLQDLRRQIQRVHGKLKAGGIFYFNFPAADSWVAKFYGERHWVFAPSAAAFLSTAGCREVLQQLGFEIIRIDNDRQKPTLSKFLGLSGLRQLYPLAKKLRVASWSPPIALPIPGVKVCRARKPFHEGV